MLKNQMLKNFKNLTSVTFAIVFPLGVLFTVGVNSAYASTKVRPDYSRDLPFVDSGLPFDQCQRATLDRAPATLNRASKSKVDVAKLMRTGQCRW